MKGYFKKFYLLIFPVLILITFISFLINPVYINSQPSKTDNPVSRKIKSHAVDIWSSGIRLSGDLFYPANIEKGKKLPAVILCHGWGGVRSHLNAYYAPLFAKAGYVVLTFDYRGFGDSDSRIICRGKMPKSDKNGRMKLEVQAIREMIDPFEQVEDITSAIDFVTGEQIVDFTKIGLWGTSYGGGHVVYVATYDNRVKCIVSQVGSMDSRGLGIIKGGITYVRLEATRRARGEIDPLPQGVDQIPGLSGTPYIAKMVNYAPVEFADRLNIPVMIIEAEKEELMNIKEHGQLVYSRIKDKSKAKYELIKGITHFKIYTVKRIEAINMAVSWFDEHLK